MRMSKRNKDIISNTLVLSIGSFVPKLLSMLTVPILTTYLSKTELGQYDLIASVILFVIPVITLQIEQGAFRFLLSSKTEEERSSYITGAFAYVLGVSGLTGAAAAVVMALARMDPVLILLIVLVLILEALYKLTGQVVRGRRRSLTYSLGAVVYSAVYMLLMYGLVYWQRLGMRGVLAATAGGYLASALYMLVSGNTCRYLDWKQISRDRIGLLLRFSIPIVPSSISLWVINFLDRIVIVAALGAEMNAFYSVATKISQLYTALYGIFTMAWTETAVTSVEDEDKEAYYSQMFRGVFRVTVGVMLGMIALTPVIYRLLINEQYIAAYSQTLVLYFGMFFNSLVSFYAGIYIALKRTREVGYSSVVGALINIVINAALIKSLGLYAASLSTVLSFLAVAVYRGLDLQKALRIRYYPKEMAGGIALMILVLGLMWKNTPAGMLASLAVAITYNLRVNLPLLKGMIKTLLPGLLRRKNG